MFSLSRKKNSRRPDHGTCSIPLKKKDKNSIMTWQHVGSRSSVPLMRLLCAMTISSSAIGFLVSSTSSSTNNQHRHYFPTPSLFTSKLTRAFSLSLQSESHITRCDDSTTTNNDDNNNKLPEEVETYHRMPLPERGQEENGHAIFGLLLGTDMIESYDIFRRPEKSHDNVIIAYVKFGDRVDGHPGVVHGGILSLCFDDAMGFAYEALGVSMAVTANLNVDYRAPVPAGTNVRISAQLERREGRKLFWKAQMTSIDKTVLYAEASSLYIIPRGSEN